MMTAMPDTVTVRVRRLPHGEGLPSRPTPAQAPPARGGGGGRGAPQNAPGERGASPTGLVVELPAGYEGQVRPRSAWPLHHGVTVANAPGTVDADYRGEVRVVLVNLGREAVTIARGDRIAQLASRR